jgi:hypothetical protein
MGNGRHWDVQHDFDREAALARLQEHPEVMPPHPEPYHPRKRTALRVPAVAVIAAVGVAIPVLVGLIRRA